MLLAAAADVAMRTAVAVAFVAAAASVADATAWEAWRTMMSSMACVVECLSADKASDWRCRLSCFRMRLTLYRPLHSNAAPVQAFCSHRGAALSLRCG